MPTVLHISGASGSGTTTLGRALAEALSLRHLDADDFYWRPTQPPYTRKREAPERLALLSTALQAPSGTVLSGSVMGWGTEVEDAFTLIVFLYLPASLRVERLRQREMGRFGRADPAFLEWAAQYDDGPPEGRSLAKHEAWLAARSAPVLRLHGDLSVSQRVSRVLAALRGKEPHR